MNLFILNNSNGKFYFKPDTCLCNDNFDFYYPESANNLIIQPGISVKIIKNGKSINAKFAERYYNKVDFALNIVHSNIFNNFIEIEDLAHFSSLERSLYHIDSKICHIDNFNIDLLLLSNGINTIRFKIAFKLKEQFNLAIEKISKVYSLKSGDLLVLVDNLFLDIDRGNLITLFKYNTQGSYSKLFDFSIK